MNDKPHISQSQVNRYLKCGLQYKYHYIDGNKKPINSAMLRGSAIDNSANVHFQNKISGGQGVSLDSFIDYAVDYHDRQEDGKGEKQEVVFDIPKAKSRDMVSELSEVYHKVFGKYNPANVQLKIEKEYDEELNFIGYVDMWLPDLQGGLVLDNKVWAKDKRTDPDLTKDTQLVKYAELLGAKKVGLSVVTYDKDKPIAKLILADITQKHIDSVNRRIDKMVEGIRKEVYNPPDQSVWWCTPKWCGYWDECEFGGK